MSITSDLRLTGAEKLAVVTTAVALLHHVDHVLRVDHSGWPFHHELTPFTFSLLVYGVIAGVLFGRGWRRTRMMLAGILALFPTPGPQLFWRHPSISTALGRRGRT